MIFVIEHLEPDVFEWCLLEYKHMSKWVGKENLLFTNTTDSRLMEFGKIEARKASELGLKNACLLDPQAEQILTPEEAKKFDYFIFGGILGDNPPRKRTGPLAEQLAVPRFNIGDKQMSTDTAVIVTKKIADGKKFEELEFIDDPEIETGEEESCILPYRYLLVENKPLLAPGVIDLLKEEE